MSNVWDSFSEYVKTRLTNSFMATIIVVWLIRNFEFVYALFNFDNGITLSQKVDYVRRYFKIHGTWTELGINVGVAFCILLFSFFLLLVARALTNGYSFLLSYLNSKTAKLTMVDNSTYTNLLENYAILKKERDILKQESSVHDKNMLSYHNEIGNLSTRIIDLESEKKDFSNENVSLKAREINFKNEVKELEKANIQIKEDLNYYVSKANLDSFKKSANSTITIQNILPFIEDYKIKEPNISIDIRSMLESKTEEVITKTVYEDFLILGFILGEDSILNVETYDLNILNFLVSLGLINWSGQRNSIIINDKLEGQLYNVHFTETGKHIYKILLNYKTIKEKFKFIKNVNLA